MNGVVDQTARDRAQRALEEIGSHEKLCVERYDHINGKLGFITKLLGWGGAVVCTVVVSVIGWLSVRAMDINDELLKARLELLQSQQQSAPLQGPVPH